jgi:hypothetical protein
LHCFCFSLWPVRHAWEECHEHVLRCPDDDCAGWRLHLGVGIGDGESWRMRERWRDMEVYHFRFFFSFSHWLNSFVFYFLPRLQFLIRRIWPVNWIRNLSVKMSP